MNLINSLAVKPLFVFLLSLGQLMSVGQNKNQKFTLHGVNDTLGYSLSIQNNIGHDITSILCNNNELKIFDVRGVTATKVHSDTFLEIQFWVRGGTGGKVRRSVLVCLLNGKPFIAMDFYSESAWRLSKVYDKVADSLKLFDEKSDYYARLSVGGEMERWHATLLESLKVESKHDPTQNTSYDESFGLTFDINGCFFYNSSQKLNGTFQVHSNKDYKSSSKFFSEEVPSIRLRQNTYLFINKGWYLFNVEKSYLNQL